MASVRRRPKDLVLILAREFASKLAFPVLITDAEGNLVFFNEPAERLLGRTFAEVGEMPASSWETLFSTEELDGSPLPLSRMPAGIALLERRPAHHTFAIRALDGVRRQLSVTALPLLASATRLVGVVAVFWQDDGGTAA